MQKARVTVTVRRDVLAKAERRVKHGRAKSVSAWVDSAMEEKARREDHLGQSQRSLTIPKSERRQEQSARRRSATWPAENGSQTRVT